MQSSISAEEGILMSEEIIQPSSEGGSGGKWILLAAALVYIAVSVYFLVDMHGTINKLTKDQDNAKEQIAQLNKDLDSAQAGTEAVAKQVGLTKRELAERAAQLQREQRAAEARIAEEQKQQISAVTGSIEGVKTDVGGVKTDLGTTKADLEATKSKLQSTVGDLGVQTGLIANTRNDLEVLKHRGDRNYFEFTLMKGAKPQPVSTISLQLKKTDQKKGKYTLNVTSDDKTIEKKDRNVSEPIQFYTGRDHMLYELVVWTVEKDKATGYLSTPKNAPTTVTAN
jgi:hypothetical protein